MKKKFFTFITPFALLFAARLHAQSLYFVKSGGTGSGATWATAAGSIPNTPVTDQKIYVAKGSYNLTGTISLNNDGVSVIGGWPDNLTGTTLAGYDPVNNATNITTSSNIMFTTGNTNTAKTITVKGFKMTSGALFNALNGPMAGTFTFADSYIANGTNGGIVVKSGIGSTTYVNNCYFTGIIGNAINMGDGSPGNAYGMANLTVNNSTFVTNGLTSGGKGGAISIVSGGDVNINNSYFCTNAASNKGGAIYAEGSTGSSTPGITLTVSGCSFNGNNSASGAGGAIYIETGVTLKVSNSKFFGNLASSAGGAIAHLGDVYGNNSITNTIFYNNIQTSTSISYPQHAGAIAGGGGVYLGNDDTKATFTYNISGVQFINNKVSASGPIGAALAWGGAPNGALQLSSSFFQGNTTAGSTTVNGSDFKAVGNQTSGSTPSMVATNDTFQLATTAYDGASDYFFTGSSGAPVSFSTSGATASVFNNTTASTWANTTAPTCPSYSSTVILPVTFSSFTAVLQNGAVKLDWTTTIETNNKGFAVERSTDGINFTKIAFVNSLANNGNSSSSLNYTATDASPLAGNNYYRLKQVDFDGNSAYSNIATVLVGASKNLSLGVYPNPVSSTSKVIIGGVSNFSSAYLTVVNGIGQAVQKMPVTQSVMGIDFNSLSHGVYYLLYTDAAGNQLQTKVVK